MLIKRAVSTDIDAINGLLFQVLSVHSSGRPDIFKAGTKKYTDAELLDIIADDDRPIFVAKKEDKVVGYAFCAFVCHKNDNILTDIKTLYIDDLCVDEKERGKGVGKALLSYVKDFARENGVYNITLNVWALNDDAIKFYEKNGLKVQKIGMEMILN